MANYLPAIFIVSYLILIGIALRLWRQSRASAFTLLIIPAVAYIFIQIIVLVSFRLESNSFLTSLSSFSFYLQLAVTPLYVMVSFELLRRAGIKWALSSWAQPLLWCVTIILIGFGLFQQYTNSTITTTIQESTANPIGIPFEDAGLEAEGATLTVVSPPAATTALGTAFGIMLLGFFMFREMRWPWMLYGAVCMFVLHALPAEQAGYGFGLFGTLVIAILLLLTAFRLYVLDSVAHIAPIQGARS